MCEIISGYWNSSNGDTEHVISVMLRHDNELSGSGVKSNEIYSFEVCFENDTSAAGTVGISDITRYEWPSFIGEPLITSGSFQNNEKIVFTLPSPLTIIADSQVRYTFEFETSSSFINAVKCIGFHYPSPKFCECFSVCGVFNCFHPTLSHITIIGSSDGSETITKPVGELVKGDLIEVYVPRFASKMVVEVDRLQKMPLPPERYIIFEKDSLLPGMPSTPFYVTPEHMILLDYDIHKNKETYMLPREVIAKHLVNNKTIRYINDKEDESIPVQPVVRLEAKNAYALVNGVYASLWGYQHDSLLNPPIDNWDNTNIPKILVEN